MTTGFTAPRSRGRRSPVKPIGSTRPAAAAPAGEPTPSVDPTPTTSQYAPTVIETVAAAPASTDPAPAAEPTPEPELPTTDPEPIRDLPQTSTPDPEPTAQALATPEQKQPHPTEPEPEQAKPRATAPTPELEQPAAPAAQPEPAQQPAPLPSETSRTSGHPSSPTPLVVIWDGSISYASSAVHVLDLDAAARADNAHDVLDAITALKEAATDGPVEELVNTLFGILRAKV
ncbi:hypothetical protein [Rhodococcus zopfii]|uniref:hypothetical protein n=1 Tax=Rhodococcus zopfii TaxID=43772 RepID=UPI000932CAF2|nr:hypothetical protein [Rhodococcus zopfii]